MTDLRERLKGEALDAGFDAVGFTHPDAIGDAGQKFREFLELGRHSRYCPRDPRRGNESRSTWRGLADSCSLTGPVVDHYCKELASFFLSLLAL